MQISVDTSGSTSNIVNKIS